MNEVGVEKLTTLKEDYLPGWWALYYILMSGAVAVISEHLWGFFGWFPILVWDWWHISSTLVRVLFGVLQ